MKYVFITSNGRDAELVDTSVRHISRYDRDASFGVVCHEQDSESFGDLPVISVGEPKSKPSDALYSLLSALSGAAPDDNTPFAAVWPPVVLMAQLENDGDHEVTAFTTPGTSNVDLGALVLTKKALKDMLLYMDKTDLPARMDFISLITRVMLGAMGPRMDLRNGDKEVQYGQLELLPAQPGTIYYNVAGPEVLRALNNAKLNVHRNMARLMETVAGYGEAKQPQYSK